MRFVFGEGIKGDFKAIIITKQAMIATLEN